MLASEHEHEQIAQVDGGDPGDLGIGQSAAPPGSARSSVRYRIGSVSDAIGCNTPSSRPATRASSFAR